MSNNQIVIRLVSKETGVPYKNIKLGKLKESEWPVIINAYEQISGLKVYLNDLPNINPRTMRRVLRTLEAKHGKMDLVIVDYLQLAGADEAVKIREQEVSQVSRGMKIIAKEFDVPVLAAAQLSRAVEIRADKRPQLSDLRESGSLEQDADVVMFLHHPDELKPETSELIIAKSRNGEIGKIDLRFFGNKMAFQNAASKMFNPNERSDE